jgi:hypothetical protein
MKIYIIKVLKFIKLGGINTLYKIKIYDKFSFRYVISVRLEEGGHPLVPLAFTRTGKHDLCIWEKKRWGKCGRKGDDKRRS